MLPWYPLYYPDLMTIILPLGRSYSLLLSLLLVLVLVLVDWEFWELGANLLKNVLGLTELWVIKVQLVSLITWAPWRPI